MTPRRFVQTVTFKTYADLQAERARTYLGFIWWFAEPLLLIGVFYLIFGLGLRRGEPGFVPFLMVGLVLWQWFRGAVSHTASSIHQNRSLVREVRLPVALFPVVTLCTDTLKFLLVFLTLLVVLWVSGELPGTAYLALPAVLLAELLLAVGVSMLVCAIVPFVPDLRFVIDPLLMAMFFLSGIFYSVDSLEPSIQSWVLLNPMAGIIEAGRAVLLHNEVPDLAYLAWPCAVGLLLGAAGIGLMHRLSHLYPKLPN